MPRCPRLALLLVPAALAFSAGLALADGTVQGGANGLLTKPCSAEWRGFREPRLTRSAREAAGVGGGAPPELVLAGRGSGTDPREGLCADDPPAPPQKETPPSNKPWIGPADESIYPPRERSPYLLPWPGGITYRCIQGNRGIVSHRGPGRYAYDFGMPVGSTVCAARAGVVRVVVVRHDGRGTDAPNNKIGVRHADGTTGWYLHLKRGGALVRPGDRVRQGQPIGLSGNVGRSLMPHLHFQVTKRGGGTIPITFRDVKADKGIPRILRMYTSGNRKLAAGPPAPAE